MPMDEIKFGRFPDRDFFWGVCFTVLPVWANKYTETVLLNRNKEKPHRFDNTTKTPTI